jgi:DNA (cytosine-5)-methyltransferase 1
LARQAFKDNFLGTRVYGGRLEHHNVQAVVHDLGSVDLVLASPECTNHTCAKGGAERDEASRATAFQVIKFARALKPRWIVVENVIQMRRWKRYGQWKCRLEKLGYHVAECVLNAAEFGVPQSRRRLYILCDSLREPPPIRPYKRKLKPAAHILSLNGTYKFSPLFKVGRAKPTLARARRAIAKLGETASFLLVYYGSDASGGWQRLNVPLRTVTTLDRFAYVKPGKEGPLMRMLQPEELKRAMGFPGRYQLNHGCRRDKIRLLGNAVCPPVMRSIIRKLVSATNGGNHGRC